MATLNFMVGQEQGNVAVTVIRVEGDIDAATHKDLQDKAAEVIEKYCHKGDMLEIRATPRQDKWTDSEGRNRSRIVLRIDNFSLMPCSTASNYVSNAPKSTETVEATPEETSPF